MFLAPILWGLGMITAGLAASGCRSTPKTEEELENSVVGESTRQEVEASVKSVESGYIASTRVDFDCNWGGKCRDQVTVFSSFLHKKYGENFRVACVEDYSIGFGRGLSGVSCEISKK